MAILMYAKKLFELSKEAHPTMEDEKCANWILKRIYPKSGDKNSRANRIAFFQDKPIEIKTTAYEHAKSLAEELATIARKPKSPRIFFKVSNVQNCGIEIFSRKEYRDQIYNHSEKQMELDGTNRQH